MPKTEPVTNENVSLAVNISVFLKCKICYTILLFIKYKSFLCSLFFIFGKLEIARFFEILNKKKSKMRRVSNPRTLGYQQFT